MRELVVSILGEYQQLTDSQGNIIGGLAGVDYEYIFGGVIFVLCLVFLGCLMRSLLIRLMN